MKVETYETAVFEDTADNAIVEGEMLNLIEELGLEGQKEVSNAGNADTTGLCPYRKMTKRELKVFKLCFPRETTMETYKESLIPLRVLQVASHAKKWLPVIKVWHPEPGKPDPVLVGFESTQWGAQPFLLARWGDALDVFETLAEKAKKFACSKLAMSMKKAQTEIDGLKALLNDTSGIDIEEMPTTCSFYTQGE